MDDLNATQVGVRGEERKTSRVKCFYDFDRGRKLISLFETHLKIDFHLNTTVGKLFK